MNTHIRNSMLVFSVILLLSGSLSAQARIKPAVEASRKWSFGFDGSLHVNQIQETGHKLETWNVRPGLSGGIWAAWLPVKWFSIRTGARYINHHSSCVLEHPYDYVFTSDATLITKSLRLPILASTHCFGWIGMPELYVGGGAYIDLIMKAELWEQKHYLYTIVHSERNVKADIPGVLDGWTIHIGSKAGKVMWMELGASFASTTFSIEGLPTPPMKQVSYYLTIGLDLNQKMWE